MFSEIVNSFFWPSGSEPTEEEWSKFWQKQPGDMRRPKKQAQVLKGALEGKKGGKKKDDQDGEERQRGEGQRGEEKQGGKGQGGEERQEGEGQRGKERQQNQGQGGEERQVDQEHGGEEDQADQGQDDQGGQEDHEVQGRQGDPKDTKKNRPKKRDLSPKESEASPKKILREQSENDIDGSKSSDSGDDSDKPQKLSAVLDSSDDEY